MMAVDGGLWVLGVGLAVPVAVLFAVAVVEVVRAFREDGPAPEPWPPLGARQWHPQTLATLPAQDGHTGPLDPVEGEIWSWTYGPGEWPLYADLCRKRKD